MLNYVKMQTCKSCLSHKIISFVDNCRSWNKITWASGQITFVWLDFATHCNNNWL